MADSSTTLSAQMPSREASKVSGTVYVIDLVGFSALTDARIASDARSGTEQVSRMVTALFGRLMRALAAQSIQFGGFAGDALIAWQTGESGRLPDGELQTLAARICHETSTDLSCRTAQAVGDFWILDIAADTGMPPLVWGAAVSDAFAALNRRAENLEVDQHVAETPPSLANSAMATASVTKRWTIVVRALSSEACRGAKPEQLMRILERGKEICAAYSAEFDNVVQDDKGLLIVIILSPSQPTQKTERDALLNSLSTGRAPFVKPQDIASKYGTVFRYRPQLADQSVAITIGRPINEAAKLIATRALETAPSLKDTSTEDRTSESSSQTLIGRDFEQQCLREAHQESLSQGHIATVIGAAGIGKTSLLQNLQREAQGESVNLEVTPGSRYLPFGSAQDLAEACNVPPSVVFETAGQAELASRLPPLVIIENWQWCDDDSKRLIRRLQNEREQGLLLISSREEIGDLSSDTRIDVEALNEARSNELIEHLAPGRLSPDLKRSIYALSQGVPFWLAQAALHYADPSDAEDAGAPLSGLESLLSARARVLSEPALALWRLFCAWRWPLAFERAQALLTRFDIRASMSHLEELNRLGWLTADESGDRPAHDILADWGVADLPVTFERDLHSAIARSVTVGKGSPSRIARHWQQAGQDLRASIWFERAAHRADRAGAHRLTVSHLNQADVLARRAVRQRPIRKLDRLALDATANWGIGKLRRAKQSLNHFDAIAKTIKNGPQKSTALQRAATIQSEVGQFAGNANLMLTGIYRGWRNRSDIDGAYEIKSRRQGFVYYALGLLRWPVDKRFQKLIQQAHAQGEYRSQALIGCAAATLKTKRCDWDDAERTLIACLNTIAQTDDRQMLGVVQCLLGLNALFQGDTKTALNWFEDVASVGREQDHHLFIVWGAYAKAEARLYAGDMVGAKALALDARALAVGLGDHQSVCIIEGVLAQIFLAEGAQALAFRHARNALRFAAKLPPSNFSTLEGIAAPAQVGAALKQAGYRPEESEALIRGGRKALRRYAQVFELAQPRRHYVEGRIALSRHDRRTAQNQFLEARSKASEIGMRYEQTLAETALTEMEESRHGATA
ncbi:MAG: hypothetical protein AAF996_04325 [Pseudomonadota bacterium]